MQTNAASGHDNFRAIKRSLLTEVASLLAPSGFERSGTTFSKSDKGDWGIVTVHLRDRHLGGQIAVDVDIAASLGILSEWYEPGSSTARPPDVSACHWWNQLRFMVFPEENPVGSWIVRAYDPDPLGALREPIRQIAVPLIDRLMTAEGMRDAFRSDERVMRPILNRPVVLSHLMVLLAKVGPREELPRTMRALRRISVHQDWEETMLSRIARVQAETGIGPDNEQ